MISIKTDTQYTAALGTALDAATAALLSQVKRFSRLDNQRVFTTREFWATELRIHRDTVRRWEDEIINLSPKLSYLYYDNGKRRTKNGKPKRGLDFYQRFLLSYIYSLKFGLLLADSELLIRGERMTNQEVLNFFHEPGSDNKPRWLNFQRKHICNQFDNYQENQKWQTQ